MVCTLLFNHIFKEGCDRQIGTRVCFFLWSNITSAKTERQTYWQADRQVGKLLETLDSCLCCPFWLICLTFILSISSFPPWFSLLHSQSIYVSACFSSLSHHFLHHHLLHHPLIHKCKISAGQCSVAGGIRPLPNFNFCCNLHKEHLASASKSKQNVHLVEQWNKNGAWKKIDYVNTLYNSAFIM